MHAQRVHNLFSATQNLVSYPSKGSPVGFGPFSSLRRKATRS